MTDIFSSRELATGIWVLAVIIFIFAHKDIRKSALGVIGAANKLIHPTAYMIIYAIGFTAFVVKLPFWDGVYLKDIIIWVLFVGIPTCYSAIGKNNQEGFYRNTIIDNIKFSAFVELVTSTFTFNLAVELALVSLFTILYLFQAVAETKDEFRPVRKIISTIIILATLTVLVFTVKEAIDTYRDTGVVDSIVSFCIPLVFSIVYLPFVYIFSIIAKYQVLFVRISFKSPKDKRVQWNYKRKVFRVCWLSHKKITRFEQKYLQQMYVSMGDEKFNELIRSFKETKGSEP